VYFKLQLPTVMKILVTGGHLTLRRKTRKHPLLSELIMR